MTYLYGRDSKGKVRVLILQAVKYANYFEIRRWSGLLNGKLTQQPLLTILKGKVNRSTYEQCELEFRSLVNKQRDKGYKLYQELINKFDTPQDIKDLSQRMNYELIDKLLPKEKTDASGARKPMLAKDVSGKPPEYYDNVDWWVSPKLDGVRLSIYRKDGKLISASRGGKSYDAACTKVFQSERLHKLFDQLGDDVVIDGEFYIHGRTLQYISGRCRQDDYNPDIHDELEFWIFDYGHPTHTAKERCMRLNNLINDFKDEPNISIVKHTNLTTHASMKMMHDHWVNDGYEGLIARDGAELYGYGSRDDRMIKMKEFQDAEFEIIGIKDGLRPEDMCFMCITGNGKQFEAKPKGPRELKYQYIRNLDLLLGKQLTVKFFNYTEDGIPYLPVGKCIRDYE